MVEVFPSRGFIPSESIEIGWEISNPEQATTPKGRRGAVLNMLQNGAQSLEVLSMDPSTPQTWFEIYQTVCKNAGFRLMDKSTTKGHLTRALRPAGIAESFDHDRSWALTDLGVAIKPALIYSWEQLLDLKVDPSDFLASTSQGKKTEREASATAATSREEVLVRLYQDGQTNISNLVEYTGLSDTAISKITDFLANNKFVTKRSVATSHGTVGYYYEITQEGQITDDWDGAKPERHWPKTPTVPYVQKVILDLEKEGLPITQGSVNVRLRALGISEHELPGWKIQDIFRRLEGRNLVKPKDYEIGEYSAVSLTQKGIDVVQRVLIPLRLWSQSPNASMPIAAIERELAQNPSNYKNLFQEIGNHFIKHSKYVNRDPEEKTKKALDLIKENPGVLTQNELGRRLNYSQQSAGRAIRALEEQGLIDLEHLGIGSQIRLWPKNNE